MPIDVQQLATVVDTLNSKFIDESKPNIAGSGFAVGALKGVPYSKTGNSLCDALHWLKENYYEFSPMVQARYNGMYLTWKVYNNAGEELYSSDPVAMQGTTSASDVVKRIEEMVSSGLGEALLKAKEHGATL